MSVPFYEDPGFAGERIAHGFFGRKGGVSTGIYDSLNCGAGTKDDPANVQENRSRVAAGIGSDAGRLVTVKQIHSAQCAIVTGPWSGGERPDADAMVTDQPEVVLGILTADCGPVLFYGEKDDGSPVIGAAHAGWGGALKGVLDSTVEAMAAKGAGIGTIIASLGPCIGPASYEVGDKFPEPFIARSQNAAHFFKAARKPGHLMFDLPGYIAARLAECGVRRMRISGIDTYAEEEYYFSYRRTTHKGEPDYGRQMSAIVIRR